VARNEIFGIHQLVVDGAASTSAEAGHNSTTTGRLIRSDLLARDVSGQAAEDVKLWNCQPLRLCVKPAVWHSRLGE
jgi:hypothetical protein